jgi:endonuclease/exonuclease/phosphatase family metal-dependent hydrolase
MSVAAPLARDVSERVGFAWARSALVALTTTAALTAIKHWNGSPRTILAGDLNPMQGDPPEYPPRVPGLFVEIRALLDAGFTTAGELDACTRPTTARNCSDFILVSPDLGQRSLEVADLFGDHRLLVTDVHLG